MPDSWQADAQFSNAERAASTTSLQCARIWSRSPEPSSIGSYRTTSVTDSPWGPIASGCRLHRAAGKLPYQDQRGPDEIQQGAWIDAEPDQQDCERCEDDNAGPRQSRTCGDLLWRCGIERHYYPKIVEQAGDTGYDQNDHQRPGRGRGS